MEPCNPATGSHDLNGGLGKAPGIMGIWCFQVPNRLQERLVYQVPNAAWTRRLTFLLDSVWSLLPVSLLRLWTWKFPQVKCLVFSSGYFSQKMLSPKLHKTIIALDPNASARKVDERIASYCSQRRRKGILIQDWNHHIKYIDLVQKVQVRIKVESLSKQ